MLSPKQMAKKNYSRLNATEGQDLGGPGWWAKTEVFNFCSWEHCLCHLNCLPPSEPNSQTLSRLVTESGRLCLWNSLT